MKPQIYGPHVQDYPDEHQSNLATHSPQKLIECLCIAASSTVPQAGPGGAFLMGGADKACILRFAFEGEEDEEDEWPDHMGPVADEAMRSIGQPPQWLSVIVPLPDEEVCSVAVSTGHVGEVTITSMTRAMRMLAFSPELKGIVWSLTQAAAKHCWGKAWEGEIVWATGK